MHAIYAKNAIGAVLADEEYNRILDGADPIHGGEPIVPDDASSLTGDTAEAEKADKIDLGKTAAPADAEAGRRRGQGRQARRRGQGHRQGGRRRREGRQEVRRRREVVHPHGTAEHAWCVVHRGSGTV